MANDNKLGSAKQLQVQDFVPAFFKFFQLLAILFISKIMDL